VQVYICAEAAARGDFEGLRNLLREAAAAGATELALHTEGLLPHDVIDACFEVIAQAMLGWPHLRQLELELIGQKDAPPCSASVSRLLPALSRSSLTSFKSICVPSAVLVGLASCTTVTKLTFCPSCIKGTTDSAVVASVLDANPITSLDIFAPPSTGLFGAIARSRTLTQVNWLPDARVSGAYNNGEAARAMLRAVQQCPTITQFDVRLPGCPQVLAKYFPGFKFAEATKIARNRAEQKNRTKQAAFGTWLARVQAMREVLSQRMAS
jgi:hypothetical protein